MTYMSNGPGPVVAADTRLYVPQALRLKVSSVSSPDGVQMKADDDEAKDTSRSSALLRPTALFGDGMVLQATTFGSGSDGIGAVLQGAGSPGEAVTLTFAAPLAAGAAHHGEFECRWVNIG